MGTFNEPGPFSAYLATIVVLEVAFLRFPVGLFSKRALQTMGGLTGVALLLTFSSRGFIEVAVGIAYLLALNLSRKPRSVTSALALGLVLTLAGLLSPRLRTGLIWTVSKVIAEVNLAPSQAVSGGRKAALYIVPEIISRHFAFGIGIGNYPFLRNAFATRVPVVEHLDLPGNTFLQVLAETGLTGLVFFLCFLGSIGLRAYRAGKALGTDERAYGLFAGTTAAAITILIDLMVSSAFYFPYVWIVLSLLVTIRQSRVHAAR
jgi:O-antigen ligase